MKTLEQKREVAFRVFMVLGMSFVISLVMTVLNGGLDSGFFMRWLTGWAMSFLIAYPTVIFVTPMAKKISERIIQ